MFSLFNFLSIIPGGQLTPFPLCADAHVSPAAAAGAAVVAGKMTLTGVVCGSASVADGFH